MNTELRKRLEEAAKEYEPDAFDADYILPAREGFIVSSKRAAFRAGAEYGYKEAVEVAKDWLKENYHLFDHFDKDEVISDFEADMNKLWEEEK